MSVIDMYMFVLSWGECKLYSTFTCLMFTFLIYLCLLLFYTKTEYNYIFIFLFNFAPFFDYDLLLYCVPPHTYWNIIIHIIYKYQTSIWKFRYTSHLNSEKLFADLTKSCAAACCPTTASTVYFHSTKFKLFETG